MAGRFGFGDHQFRKSVSCKRPPFFFRKRFWPSLFFFKNSGFTPEQIAARNQKIADNRVIDHVLRSNVMKKLRSDPEFLKKNKEGQKRFLKKNGGGSFKDRKHTPETIIKMSKSSKGMGAGKQNSQYGTCWIHNNRVSKKIDKDDLEIHLIEGWIKGRKIKFTPL